MSARLMCRVGVHDLGLVMAWVDQFASRPDADTSGTNDQSRDEQNPSASPKEVSPDPTHGRTEGVMSATVSQ